MRFEVLGPVRVVDGSREIRPLSELRKRLLAVLLVRANRAVSTDLLADVVWGEDLPERPAKSLQVHMYRLRSALDRPDRLTGVRGAYQLEVGPSELDAAEFAGLHDDARMALADGDVDGAVAAWRAALGLWRGAPFADVDDGVVVGPEARRLAEARLIAAEELYEVELGRGRTREVVPELTELVAAFPLRERFVALLMVALYRSGRQARALTAYRALRQRLAKELGAEPGRELRELHDAIRADDQELLSNLHQPADTGPSAPGGPPADVAVTPGQLPPIPGGFAGRTAELSALDDILHRAEGAPVVVITGPAGVGKTGLAIRFGHAVADRLGDGQLYVDLRGHSRGAALEPLDALGRLVRSLGADPVSAEAVEEVTAQYRSLLAGRKMLVLLDNADSAAQIRPLLAGTPGCLTLITSRSRLPGLVAHEGAHRIDLDVLPPADAVTLLDALLGGERVGSQPEDVSALIEACSGLPLALRVAAAQLSDEPYRAVGEFVAELRERGPAVLALDDDLHSAVAAAFDSSYHRLDDETGRLFRLLGLVPGPTVSLEAAAALGGVAVPEAHVALRRLVGAHLITEPAAGRYQFHDLMRAYAEVRAVDEESARARREALERLFAWYYQGKRHARELLVDNRRDLTAPDLPLGVPEVVFRDHQAATAWLTAELDNIAAAVRAAHTDDDLRRWSWHLTIGLAVMMTNRGFVSVALPMTRSAVEAARAAHDLDAMAHTLTEQGTVQFLAGLPVQDDVLDEALQLTERMGDDSAFGYCLNLAGIIQLRKAELDVAETHLTRALASYQRAGDTGGQCLTLNNLGAARYVKGDVRGSIRAWEEILRLLGDEISASTTIALANLIQDRVLLGRLDGIAELAARAHEAATQIDDPAKASRIAFALARWHRELGRYEAALEEATAAKSLADEVAQPHLQGEPREEVGWCRLAVGDAEAARTEFAEARSFAEVTGGRDMISSAARGLAEVSVALGDLEAAESYAREAAELARGSDRVGEAESVRVLARVLLAAGRHDDAVTEAESALAQHRVIGSMLGQARASRVLGEALIATNEPAAVARGAEHLREALRGFEAFGSPEAAEVGRLVNPPASALDHSRS